MAQTKTILTNYGNEQILRAIAEERQIVVHSMVYGDGGGASYNPSPSQTALVNQMGELDNLTREVDSEDFIYFSTVIPANAPECAIRELGLKDEDGGLLAVCCIPTTTKPAAEEGLEVSLPISIGFRTSTGEVMTIYVDKGEYYPTKQWVINKFDGIKEIHSTKW